LKISERIAAIRPSATLEVTARSIALRAQGVDVVDFGAGEPDFDTPEHIKQAAVAALARGETKYTPVAGSAALRDAIVTKLRRDNGLEYALGEVIASCGGKHALYNAFMAMFEPGDEVIVPTPYWTSYPDMLALAGVVSVLLPAPESRGFRIAADDLRQAISERTRGFILNSPSNPTGAAYAESELRELVEVLREFPEVAVVSDDIYERMVYDGRDVPPHVGVIAPELRDRLVVTNSLSKTYAMTGWRLGYTAAPAFLVKAMATLQGQSTSNPTSIAQAAGVAALLGPQDCVTEMVAEFEKRRDFIVERLRSIPDLEVVKPDGAFYVFPNVGAYLGKRAGSTTIGTGTDLAVYLLEHANVALVGGDAFGSPSHVRISYANSMENLARGCDRIGEALSCLEG
jgi:aspartate aminotransferase